MKVDVDVILSSTEGIPRRTAALKSTRVNAFISSNTCYKNELLTTNKQLVIDKLAKSGFK